MPDMQPDQALFLLNTVYLPGIMNEHRITKDVIGAIPADKMDYKPDAVSKSAGDLAWHIATSELMFLRCIAAGVFEFGPTPKPESVGTPAGLVQWYSEQFQASVAKLTAMTPEELNKVIDFRGFMQMPAVMFLGFLLHHSVHHRGQLSMYLRPTGAKIPAIYGESYDSAEARKAAMA